MKRILLLIIATTFLYALHAQVTIGSEESPNVGALLDLKENSAGTSERGLGLPRVKLSKIDQLFPMFGEVGNVTGDYDTDKPAIDLRHQGLVIYNVHTDLEEGLCPGVYLWEGDIWVRLPEPCAPPLRIENSPNSFIVAPGSSVEIPCGKPYLVAQERSDLPQINLTDKVYLEVLWQDTQNLIDKVELVGDDNGPYSKFKVSTKSGGTTGNALVALRMGTNGNASDPIVWSWHIWVTDYNPNSNLNGTTYPHNNGDAGGDYVFMDRNLGAMSASPADESVMGLTYQWGRKDPFTPNVSFAVDYSYRPLYNLSNTVLNEVDESGNGGNSGTGIKHKLAPTDKANNLEYSIQNPMTFYYGPVGSGNPNVPFDWFTSADDQAVGDNNLWGATKSAFDPCPEGWQVPAYSAATNKSPFAHFLSEESWGWVDDKPSYVTTDPSGHGLNLGANPATSVTTIGFYPFSLLRWPRESYTAGSVGGGVSVASGGFFWLLSENWARREGPYWTATANTGNASAKLGFIDRDIMMGVGDFIQAKELPRSTGAYVRCVKASTTP